MNRYDIYQRMKNWTEVPVRKLIVNEVPERPWMYLTVDFITKLLVVAKKDVILVVCDRLFKMAYFVTITKVMLVEGLVRLFRNNM